MDLLITIVAIVALFVGLPVLVLLTRDHFDGVRSRRWAVANPEKVPGTPEYIARLTTPDFEAVEKRVNRRLPSALRDLYLHSGIIGEADLYLIPPGASDFDEAWEISAFCPVDECLADFDRGRSGLRFDDVIIAIDGSGGLYYVPLAEVDDEKCPVAHFHHDGGDKSRVAESLDEFVTWRRATDEEVENWQLAGESG